MRTKQVSRSRITAGYEGLIMVSYLVLTLPRCHRRATTAEALYYCLSLVVKFQKASILITTMGELSSCLGTYKIFSVTHMRAEV